VNRKDRIDRTNHDFPRMFEVLLLESKLYGVALIVKPHRWVRSGLVDRQTRTQAEPP
jgi:hypothetical protein